MITLNFNLEEVQALIDTIEYNLDVMYEEIRHTDNIEYKDSLRQRREVLKRLQEEFERSLAEQSEPAA